MKKIMFLLPAIVAGVFIVLAGCSDGEANGNGWKGSADRTVESRRGAAPPVTEASLAKLDGTLVYDDPEWYLDTGDETVALHLGNSTYRESLEEALDFQLEDGAEVTAFGIMEEDGLSVARITTGDGEMVLRSDTGVPRWAGRGNRTSQNDRQGGGRGAGQGAGQGRDGATGRGAGEGDGQGYRSDISGTDTNLL